MQQQVSSDGQWQWDGAQWQPRWTGPTPGETPRKGRKAPWIVGICVVVAAAVAVPVVLIAAKHKDSGPKPALELGRPVTQAVLDQASPADLYWQILQRQMTQPIEQLSAGLFKTPAEFAAHTDYDIQRLALDRRTGKFTYGDDAYARGETYARARCYRAESYAWNGAAGKWERLPDQDDDCQQVSTFDSFAATDGIVANGLTDGQAGKVIKALRSDYAGFVNPGKPTLIKAGGHSYIRQTIDFKPIKLDDGEYWGSQILTFAFKRSGLDPLAWHWYSVLAGGEGLRAVYYVDPATLLPVAGIQRATPRLDGSGHPAGGGQTVLVYNYAFPKAVPAEKLGGPMYTFTLPEGWKLP